MPSKLDCLEIARNRVGDQFLVELVAEHDDILKLRGERPLVLVYQIWASRINLNRHRWTIVARPRKLSVPKKIVEPKIRSKAPTTSVFLAARVHSKALQHL